MTRISLLQNDSLRIEHTLSWRHMRCVNLTIIHSKSDPFIYYHCCFWDVVLREQTRDGIF